VPVEEFTLEGRKEALASCVVVRVADAAHRRPDPVSAQRAEGDRRVLSRFKGSSQCCRVQ
jgi:hypothetical protein